MVGLAVRRWPACVKWLLFLAPFGVLAQTPVSPVDNWPALLTGLGGAAPFVVYIIRDNSKKEARIVALEQRNQELTDAAIERIVPLQMQTIEVLTDTKTEMRTAASERERAIVMMHQMSGRLDPQTLVRIMRALERMEPRDDEDRRRRS